MGYRSDVVIGLGPKAYEMVMSSIDSYNKKNSEEEYGYRFKPETIKTDGTNFVIEFCDCKWYDSFEDVKSVENVLKELREDKYEHDEDYAFKEIRLGEDNATEEYSNSAGDDVFCDLYIECYISTPDDFKEIEDGKSNS